MKNLFQTPKMKVIKITMHHVLFGEESINFIYTKVNFAHFIRDERLDVGRPQCEVNEFRTSLKYFPEKRRSLTIGGGCVVRLQVNRWSVHRKSLLLGITQTGMSLHCKTTRWRLALCGSKRVACFELTLLVHWCFKSISFRQLKTLNGITDRRGVTRIVGGSNTGEGQS